VAEKQYEYDFRHHRLQSAGKQSTDKRRGLSRAFPDSTSIERREQQKL